MNRLTHYLADGKTATEPKNRTEGLAFAAKLAAYEDAEENDTLIKLPCKVGDTVWCEIDHTSQNRWFITTGVYACVVDNFKINKYCTYANITITREREWHLEPDTYKLCVRADTIFLTREEAVEAYKHKKECDG